MNYIMLTLTEFTKTSKKQNNKRNLVIGGLGALALTGLALSNRKVIKVKSFLRKGKVVKEFERKLLIRPKTTTNLLPPNTLSSKEIRLQKIQQRINNELKKENRVLITSPSKVSDTKIDWDNIGISKINNEIPEVMSLPTKTNYKDGRKFIREIDDLAYDGKLKINVSESTIEELEKLDEIFAKKGYKSPRLASIVSSKGKLKPPTVLDKNQYEKLAKDNNYIRLYRGVGSSSKNRVDDFIEGKELFLGDGQYGSGLYFTSDKKAALSYANNKEENILEVLLPKQKMKETPDSSLESIYQTANPKIHKITRSKKYYVPGGQPGVSEANALAGFDYHIRDNSNNNISEYILYNTKDLYVKARK